uniref:Putative nanos n=1 Tax=Culex tarsalis TaxID=7177 RepID=A0A1Q3EVG7_CULTA
MFPTRFPMVDPAFEVDNPSPFGMYSWCSSSNESSLFSSPPSSSSLISDDLSGLAASFQSALALDLEAFGRDALGMQHARPDVALVRQDFVRNGIDSAIPGRGSVRRRPPGFVQEPVSSPRWPLNSLENVPQTSTPVEQPPPKMATDGAAAGRSRRKHKENDYCVFCYNNGEHQEVYMSHVCRDDRGQVQCPRLRRYICPYCFATDRNAHTKKYCPNKPIITPEDLLKMPPGGVEVDGALAPVTKAKSKKSLRF